MTVMVPAPIELTADEAELLARIEFDPNPYTQNYLDVLRASCAAAKPLAQSLLRRGGIPTIRWEYFTEPRYNVRGHRSREQIFEDNGTKGPEILEDPNFLKHLRYFIHGPKLPKSTVEGFCSIAASVYTSGMIRTRLRAFARKEIRDRGIDRIDGADAFYQLALEGTRDFSLAESVRRAAMSAR